MGKSKIKNDWEQGDGSVTGTMIMYGFPHLNANLFGQSPCFD
jgi:hypothetical protein